MKQKETKKQPTPEVTPPARTFDSYKAILALKEEDIKALAIADKRALLDACIAEIKKREETGDHTIAEDIREQLTVICKYIAVVGGAEDLRRQDWESNHSSILSYIHNHVLNYYSFPTVNKIAQETKLSRQTVHKHLGEGIANKYYQEKLKYWEYLTEGILKNLYKESINGNVAASKVLLDNIYRMNQPAPTNIRQQTNYVQINNTKIDEVVIAELPEAARLQIVDIINEYTKKTA